MTINVFEGARRIAKLAGTLLIFVVVVVLVINWSDQDTVKLALIFLFAGLASLWALTWATGWIVRGFMGIPRGKDHRPSTPEK